MNTLTLECPVCYSEPDTAIVLKCKHVFCMNCIMKWTSSSSQCPICRQEYNITVGSPRTTRNKVRRLQTTIQDLESIIDDQDEEITQLQRFIDSIYRP